MLKDAALQIRPEQLLRHRPEQTALGTRDPRAERVTDIKVVHQAYLGRSRRTEHPRRAEPNREGVTPWSD